MDTEILERWQHYIKKCSRDEKKELKKALISFLNQEIERARSTILLAEEQKREGTAPSTYEYAYQNGRFVALLDFRNFIARF